MGPLYASLVGSVYGYFFKVISDGYTKKSSIVAWTYGSLFISELVISDGYRSDPIQFSLDLCCHQVNLN
jgi:hypothetical protein